MVCRLVCPWLHLATTIDISWLSVRRLEKSLKQKVAGKGVIYELHGSFQVVYRLIELVTMKGISELSATEESMSNQQRLVKIDPQTSAVAISAAAIFIHSSILDDRADNSSGH